MTPQMIEILVYFLIAVFFKESFDFAGMEKAKEIASLAVIITALRFICLVQWQWQYLG
ncbi:hypothetical protein [Anaerococcus tetradius]|nr:hypothetical protein [Anaerococcus tetradius]